MEVGAPASGIEFASSAKARTPRHEDLEAGIWARGSFPPAASVAYPKGAAGWSGRPFPGVWYP